MDASGNGTVRVVGRTPFAQSDTLPAIMYDTDKVLTLDTRGDAWIMDMSGPVPTFQRTAALGELRHWSNMTLLADGSVMLSGGSAVDVSVARLANRLDGVTNEVAIWNPVTGEWTRDDDAAVARLYHSSTILLPDATVLSLGGGAPGPLNNLNGEIFKPGYLFDENGQLAERPTIVDAPTDVAQGQEFQISVDDASAISRLTLVKYGAVTHSLNPESRMLNLSFTVGADGKITVDLPDNANLVTPGYWMLFAFNDKGTPSVAATINVGIGGEMYSDAAQSFMTLNGSAAYDTQLGVFELTQNARNQIAGAMTNSRVDLSHDFAISFDAFFGANDRGGEGLSFLLHNDPHGADAAGRGTGAFGTVGIRDGLGIEFDTAFGGRRSGDLQTDHTNFFDTDAAAALSRVTTPVDLGNIENGAWHKVEVFWDVETQTLTYTFNGATIGTLNRDIVKDFLGGSDFAYFGFTAATTRATNAQQIKINSVDAVFEDTSRDRAEGPFDVSDPAGHVNLNGNASFLGSSNVFRLTGDLRAVSGNIMSNERIQLSHDFSISFDVFLGSNNNGADGMAFVLHNDPRGAEANGGRGSALGAFGILNGLAIEFDTYDNGARAGDIRDDHAAFFDTDGSGIALSRPSFSWKRRRRPVAFSSGELGRRDSDAELYLRSRCAENGFYKPRPDKRLFWWLRKCSLRLDGGDRRDQQSAPRQSDGDRCRVRSGWRAHVKPELCFCHPRPTVACKQTRSSRRCSNIAPSDPHGLAAARSRVLDFERAVCNLGSLVNAAFAKSLRPGICFADLPRPNPPQSCSA